MRFAMGISLSIAAAALGIVLLHSHTLDCRRAGCRFLFLAAGSLLACFLLVQEGQRRAFVGLPPSSIVAYDVRLTDDSLRTQTGNMLYRGRLLSVVGDDGTVAAARGTVTVTTRGRARDWGSTLRFRGVPEPGDGTGPDWIGRAGREAVQIAGNRSWYFSLRSRCKDWTAGRMRDLRESDAALLTALFLGARDDLGEADSFFFRRAGAIHLLALSGFHLGILSMILVGILGPLAGKTRAAAIAGVLLVAYLFVAGPKISLIRAVMMFGLLAFCRLGRIKARGFDLLCLTFLLSAVSWPSSLRTLSFELSYLALAGILLLAPTVAALLTAHLPKIVRLPLSASLAAQFTTIPVLASHFGLLYPVGLLSALVLTPLVTAFLWGGLAYIFVPLPPLAAGLLSELLALVHRTLTASAELFARVEPIRVAASTRALLLAACGVFLLRLPALLTVFERRFARRRVASEQESGLAVAFPLQSRKPMMYDSPKQIAQFLSEHGFSMKKRLGQNFLVSPGVRERIVKLVAAVPDGLVWEIGGGIGSLTHRLVEAAERLIVFEIDHGFARVLEREFGEGEGVEVVAGDYLKTWAEVLRRRGQPSVIVGNLPYRCAAPIIATLVEWERPVEHAVFTVQREIARRMAAVPGTKDYSGFSLVCQAVFEVSLHSDIAPASFYPVPEVTSSIVTLTPSRLARRYDRRLYAQVVRDLFASRRKTIRNNLLSGAVGSRFGAGAVDAALERSSINPRDRGERLSVDRVVTLVEALSGESSPADGRS